VETAVEIDRARGALLGAHAGDALGATVGFSAWSTIRAEHPDGLREIVGGGPFDWPAGHATDDTDLTRAVLLAYLDAASTKDREGPDAVRAAANHMLAWLDGDWPDRKLGMRPADVGGATMAGLERYRRLGDPRAAGAGAGQAGHGSLMRCLPTGIAVGSRERRIRESLVLAAS